MKRFIFIPLILTGAFALSSCTLLNIFDNIRGGGGSNSHQRKKNQMKFYSTLDGEPSDDLNFDCPYALQEYTYSEILKDMDQLEDPKVNQNLGRVDERSGYYYAKTFYVKNTGETNVNYEFKLKITECKGGIDRIVRVMLFSNFEGDGNHYYDVYAHRSSNYHETDEGINYDELISTEEYGYARQFISETVVFDTKFDYFSPTDVLRMTTVFWLEGYDPESYGEAPQQAKITFGFEDSCFEI